MSFLFSLNVISIVYCELRLIPTCASKEVVQAIILTLMFSFELFNESLCVKSSSSVLSLALRNGLGLTLY